MSEESRRPGLPEVLEVALREGIGRINSIKPGKVVSYNDDEKTAEIELALKADINFVEGTEVEEVKPLPRVPILFSRSSDYFISFPLSKGDKVLVLFCDRSIEKYMDSNGKEVVDPIHRHMHDYSDAVAIPTFFPYSEKIKDINLGGLAMGCDNNGMKMIIKKTGSIEVTYAGGTTLVLEGQGALASLALGTGAVHAAIAEQMEIFYTIVNSVLTIWANTHFHKPLLPATDVPLVMPPWLSTIKSSKVSFPIG